MQEIINGSLCVTIAAVKSMFVRTPAPKIKAVMNVKADDREQTSAQFIIFDDSELIIRTTANEVSMKKNRYLVRSELKKRSFKYLSQCRQKIEVNAAYGQKPYDIYYFSPPDSSHNDTVNL